MQGEEKMIGGTLQAIEAIHNQRFPATSRGEARIPSHKR
jgi:hypothetical protein